MLIYTTNPTIVFRLKTKDINFPSKLNSIEINEKISKIVEIIKSHPNVIAISSSVLMLKGEATPLSDIDIAIIMENPTPEAGTDIGSLSF